MKDRDLLKALRLLIAVVVRISLTPFLHVGLGHDFGTLVRAK